MKFLALLGVILFYQTAALAVFKMIPPSSPPQAAQRRLMDLFMDSKSQHQALETKYKKALDQVDHLRINFNVGEIQSEKYLENKKALDEASNLIRDTEWNMLKYAANSPEFKQALETNKKARAEYNTLNRQQKELIKDLQSRSVLFQRGKNNAQFQRLRSIITKLENKYQHLESARRAAIRTYGRKSKRAKNLAAKQFLISGQLAKYHDQYQELVTNIMGEEWKQKKVKARDHLEEITQQRQKHWSEQNAYKIAHQCVSKYYSGDSTAEGMAWRKALHTFKSNRADELGAAQSENPPASGGSVQ